MKKSVSLSRFVCTLAAALLFIGWTGSPARADATIKPIEGMSYDVNASLADNLKPLIGKRVYVTVATGATFAGFVKSVGNHLLHLEKLGGKEFFDALIRIENITAVEAKFRDFSRDKK